MVKKGLGKGLQALIPNNNDEGIAEGQVREINLDFIKPNAFQPRRVFDETKLNELSDSIKEHGVVQPILVRKTAKDAYEIVAGERRLKAAKKAGLKSIPVVLKEYNDREMAEIAIIENIQREDLNPIEEAQAYKKLMDEYGLTQEQLSNRVGKSRPFIANIVRLLNLNPTIQEFLSKGLLSAGHARSLLGIEKKEQQLRIAEDIIKKNLSVRETERIIKNQAKDNYKTKIIKERPKDTIFGQIEEKLREHLGTQVKVKKSGNKGKIEIDYYNEDDMERVIEILLGKVEF